MTKSTVGGMDSDEGRMGDGIVNDVVKEGVCDGTGSRNRRGPFFECSLFRVVVAYLTLSYSPTLREGGGGKELLRTTGWRSDLFTKNYDKHLDPLALPFSAP